MIHKLIQASLKELQEGAFRIRKTHFGNELTFSIPNIFSYPLNGFASPRDRFVAISVTGNHCDLRCGHCQGKLLEAMVPAENPQTF
jgi:lipoyl synthase